MNLNKAILLLLIGLAAIAVGIFYPQTENTDAQVKTPWLNISGQQKNNLKGVRIYDENHQLMIDAQLINDDWLMHNKANYPIDAKLLAQWFNDVSSAVNIEAKTSKQENFAVLGLAENASETGGNGRKVELEFASGKSISFLLGKRANSGRYARLSGKNQTWLLDTAINVPNTAQTWLDKQVFDLEQDEVATVSASENDKLRWTITAQAPSEETEEAKSASDTFVLLDIPPNRELQYASIVPSYLDSLLSLRFEDVSTQDNTLWENLDTFTVDVELSDNRNFTLHFLEQEETRWLKVEGLDDKFNNWQFTLATYQFNNLNKVMEDFLKPLPDETDENTNGRVDSEK
ncbi:DUF4340 domain-containing protein [Catenovulum sediminis]|uniref:DUF4340 domain-containing protein n=1 Tax=Catenovulum sediminis TaxID=1740262 RepID=A0ABV1RJX0_9ALTE